ncbi:MAG: S8 family serine peptidase [Ignavibacterium sp.]|nr:S8 family serine peptidase [Ignavibacterium sp.]MDW8375048.1 S8 family serine peptidase [Ignavibacteriales bacterium]
MHLKILLFLSFLLSFTIYSQNKYLIYFIDKGVPKDYPLLKSTAVYQEALSSLAEKAIQRRLKHSEEIISYEDLPIKKEYIQLLNSLGINIKHKLNWFNCVSAYIPEEKINLIKSLPFVEKVEPVKSLTFKKSFNSSIFNKFVIEYGSSFNQLNLSDIPSVHSKGITGKDILIGLLDTGFDWKTHEALKTRKIIAEYDFINNDTITANQPGDPQGQDSHGTYVLSIIAGYKDSVMIGSAFNSSFLLAKTENIASETNVEEDDYAAALIWMENLGVDITSSSLGYSEFDPGSRSYTYQDMNGKTTIVAKALDMAFKKGVVTFTSAGNEGNTLWRYIVSPADAFNVISVGAVNSQNQLASFSSRGPTSDGRIKPEVVAVGVDVFGAISGTTNQYLFASGTSAAAPIAAGVGALLLSKFPYLKNSQVRNIILESSANSSTPNNQIGYGLISAKNAIEFSNIKIDNNRFLISQAVLSDNKIISSMKMFYSVNNTEYRELNFSNYSDDVFQFILPQLNFGDEIKFYFTYSDSSGNIFNIPRVRRSYVYYYGNSQVNLFLSPSSNSYSRISDLFPNPFNPSMQNETKIAFKSLGNEKVSVSIIDASGQVVKNISKISSLGENFIEWDGYSDRGFLCASGVYYFLITIGEEKFGKKLILIK